jgi:hypothetical protein
MNEPDYFIINPLQIELSIPDKINSKTKIIEQRFYNKLDKLINIQKELKNIKENFNRSKIQKIFLVGI